MDKTIEATWRDGFLSPEALVAPKVNDLYGRKSMHIIDKIQRMLRINTIAIVVGAPIGWIFLVLTGMPYYAGGIVWAGLMLLVVAQRLYIPRFEAPDTGLDSYHYVKAFHDWLKDRMARSKRVQRHFYALVFLALAIGVIGAVVRNIPEIGGFGDLPGFVIALVVAGTVVVELFGGVIFDFDVNLVYRGVFRKLDEMVAEMEELRG